MTANFLYEQLNNYFEMGGTRKEIPHYLVDNLNPRFELRPYQKEAFERFFHYYDMPGREQPRHLLFNMATGSGKTLIMAGLMLFLYEKGYRNFLFFVNSTNIIAKTKDNFLNRGSSKYLFNHTIRFGTGPVRLSPVNNFEGNNTGDINVCFTTIQQLHIDLNGAKENALTFEDLEEEKLVLLADEAHHMNVSTMAQQALDQSWEVTVERIFRKNNDNFLLEFTATLDYTHASVVNKYRDKVLYYYDLRQFRNDGYSKDVYVVQSKFEETDRIIQALILSQYKQEVAVRYKINLKPVILFKAQRTIAQSKENKARFHEIVRNLGARDLQRIQEKSDLQLVQRAFTFFAENRMTHSQLAERIRREFDESRCISVNEEKEKESQQILLNTLEDKDNRIRAIFAVQKLNEGWDVLNLFDIVRCYSTRDAKAGKPGKTTIAEAQLIGRGARYFPFATDNNSERYRRKFDRNLNEELRILEELHYHSASDSKYISELRAALVDEGLIDDKEIKKTLRLKDSFKETDFYKYGLIYLNERVRNNYKQVQSFSDFGISSRNHVHSLATGKGKTEAILQETGSASIVAEGDLKDVQVSRIPFHIVRNALARHSFFTFESLKTYFPYLRSIREFIERDDYCGGLTITFQGDASTLQQLPNDALLAGITTLLERIESEIRAKTTEYIGTEDFSPNKIQTIFTDKSLKLIEYSERADGDEGFIANHDWYIFHSNFGTSEEKAFVRTLETQIDWLDKRFTGIYLARNERHFKIYNFADGQAFEPDFVLFLRDDSGNMLTYQLFVEPKGQHLQMYDKWKEDFLKRVTQKYEGKTLEFETMGGRKQSYRLVGVPFYSTEDENDFKETLHEVLEQRNLHPA